MKTFAGTGPALVRLAIAAALQGCGGDVGRDVFAENAESTTVVERSTPDVSAVPIDASQVRDSFGIEIVYSSAPAWDRGIGWTIDPSPMLEIGQTMGDTSYLFTSIREAVRFSDGRIAVVDQGSRSIRLFARDGLHLATLGGAGQGPGEFGNDPFIAIAEPDIIVAWDQRYRRLSRFEADGRLLQEVSLVSAVQELDIPLVSGGIAWRVRSDGALLSTTGPITLSFTPGFEEMQLTPILIRDDGERAVHFGSLPGPQAIRIARPDGRGTATVGNPFSPRSPMALGIDPLPLAVGGNQGWEVTLYGMDGKPGRIIRAAVPRIPVAPSILDRERQKLPEIAEQAGAPTSVIEDAFRQLPIPDSIPAIGDVRWSTDGYLWVGRRSEDAAVVSIYDVVDPAGRWLGSVQIPPGIGRILEFGGDYLLTVWTGELDVPFLRLYHIWKHTE